MANVAKGKSPRYHRKLGDLMNIQKLWRSTFCLFVLSLSGGVGCSTISAQSPSREPAMAHRRPDFSSHYFSNSSFKLNIDDAKKTNFSYFCPDSLTTRLLDSDTIEAKFAVVAVNFKNLKDFWRDRVLKVTSAHYRKLDFYVSRHSEETSNAGWGFYLDNALRESVDLPNETDQYPRVVVSDIRNQVVLRLTEKLYCIFDRVDDSSAKRQ